MYIFSLRFHVQISFLKLRHIKNNRIIPHLTSTFCTKIKYLKPDFFHFIFFNFFYFYFFYYYALSKIRLTPLWNIFRCFEIRRRRSAFLRKKWCTYNIFGQIIKFWPFHSQNFMFSKIWFFLHFPSEFQFNSRMDHTWWNP